MGTKTVEKEVASSSEIFVPLSKEVAEERSQDASW